MILLISGSRQASSGLHRTARLAVDRARMLGWSIIVGDAAGIDTTVIRACEDFSVPCHVYGITERPRTKTNLPYTQVHTPTDWVLHPYLYRDQVMVQQADIVYCIWNGTSKGTKWTYDCAIRLGKTAYRT